MSNLPPPCAPSPDEIIRRIYAMRRREVVTFGREPNSACFRQIGRASGALAKAREEYNRDPAKAWNLVRHESKAIWSRVEPNGPKGKDGTRWIENRTLAGLRFVGLYADVDKSARHNGWYLDSDGMGETASGVVYQLPARKGRVRLLAGMADPYNYDKRGRGPAKLDMDIIEDVDADDARLEAARRGDRIAERYAEREREYLEAYAAGEAAREKAREALEAGKAWVKLLRAARNAFATRRARGVVGITLAETLAAFRRDKEAIREACERYQDARDEARAARDEIGAYAWRDYGDVIRDGYANG